MTLTCLCDCHGKINPCENCIRVDCVMNQGHITWSRGQSNRSVKDA